MISTSVKQTELELAAKELLDLMIRRGENAVGRLQEVLVSEMSGFGTGENEVALKLDDYLPLFKREALQMMTDYRLLRITPKVAGSTGVVEGELLILAPTDKDMVPVYDRFTFVFTLENGSWKGVSYHLSTPKADQAEGEALAFDATKARNQELEKLVAEKNRELQIEAALEKVRSRSMAMQRTDELADVATLLFQQVRELGIETWTTGFNVWLQDDTAYEDYVTNPEGGFIKPYTIDLTQFPVFIEIREAKLRGEEFFVRLEEGDAIKETYQHLMTYAPEQYGKLLEEDFQFPLRQYEHLVFGKTVSLMFITYEPVPEAHDIFKRFGKVFEQTYTRFLDLQKAEAQAREAQIEMALERVRSTSLAMHHSDELGKIVLVLSERLADLGLSFDGTLIFIFNFDKRHISLWIATNHLPAPLKVNLPYESDMMDNPILRDLWNAIDKRESNINRTYTGKAKDDYFQYVGRHNGENIPPGVRQLQLALPAWSLSFVAEKNSVLAIDNWSGKNIDKVEFNILSRFAVVFEQAYTRFLDLQKAEAQAHEAKIEAALERVRSTSLAMQKSHELQNVITIVFEKLRELGLSFEDAGIQLYSGFSNDILEWVAAPDQLSAPTFVNLPFSEMDYHESEMFRDILLAKTKGEDIFNKTYSIDEKNKYFNYLHKYNDVTQLPEDVRKFQIEASRYTISLASEKNSAIWLDSWSGQTISIEDFEILKRVAKVFEQSYTRFLDLQKAEAQAREAQIEAALERVRARTMAMQESSELIETAELLFDQLRQLGAESQGVAFAICDKESIMVQKWASIGVFSVPYTFEEGEQRMYEAWKNQVEIYEEVYEGERLKKYYELFMEIPEFRVGIQKFIDSGHPLPSWHKNHAMPFKYGYLLLITSKPFEETQIFIRFAKVFEQTYTRFLDLKKAEAQARESQIEAALERVRSRTMAMHKSEELQLAANLLFTQIQSLGIPVWSCGYNIWEKGDKECTGWMSSEGLLQPPFKIPLRESQTFKRFVDSKEKGEIFYVEEIGGEALSAHYEFMLTLPDFALIAAKHIEAGYSLPTFQINNVVNFKHGNLIFITSVPVPEAHDVFRRFALVFEQTYTRFLDLQKAEVQAREAQIETALERIRARALAMHQSDELMEVALTLREQMGLLGQKELEASVIQFYHLKKETIRSWHVLNTPGSEKGNLSAGSLEIRKNACRLKHQFFAEFQSEESEYSIVAERELLWDWLDYLRSISPEVNASFKALQLKPEMAYFHFSKFSEGALLMVSSVPATEETRYLQRRAAQVFELAYKRYKDLKQAEKLAKKAKLDYIRLREEKRRTDEALKELTATQAQLIHAEKMASLGLLTAGIAHEIQNPLNFVNNFSEVSTELVEELRAGPFLQLHEGERKEAGDILQELAQNLNRIHHHGQRADAIVKNMLLHSRASTGQKEPTDINALADEYLRLAYYGFRTKDKGFDANLVTEFDGHIGRVEVVPQDLGRVLLNLYNNAFYATQEKRSQLNGQYQPEVKVTTHRFDGRIEIRVRDNGTGIPENVKNKIFQPFFTTKPTGQGTGLGLSLGYDIITKGHRGELSVATKQGEWAEFAITLPSVSVAKEPTLHTAPH